jgi:micrococcal nuclease
MKLKISDIKNFQKSFKKSPLLVIVFVILLIGYYFGSSTQSVNISSDGYLVDKVIDGDTIEVVKDNKKMTIRYIGVNTPETVKPNSPVECFGKEASNFNKSLVENKEVFLESDVGDTDKYGRFLRYVYIKDGENKIMINKILLSEGYANIMTIQPNVKYQEEFKSIEKKAMSEQKGLWDQCK